MDEKEKRKKEVEEQELLELQKAILSAKNQNELILTMQRYNLWREETATNNIKPRSIKNTYDYSIQRQREEYSRNFRLVNPEAKLKTYRQRIGYVTKEQRFQDRIKRARQAGLSEADIELLKKLNMESVLDDED